jgi:hypothetical protein
VCQIQAGMTGLGTESQGREPASRVPIVRIVDIAGGRIASAGLASVDRDVAGRLGRYALRVGDLLCVRTGDLGRTALATEENAGWLAGSGLLRLRPKSPVIPRYLVHYLEHPEVREWIRRSSTGSVIASLSASGLGELPVVVPPLDAQRSMTDILGTLDEKIAVHEEIARATAELRGSVLRLLFAGEHPPFGAGGS